MKNFLKTLDILRYPSFVLPSIGLFIGILIVIFFNIFDSIAYNERINEELKKHAPQFIHKQSKILNQFIDHSRDIISTIADSDEMDTYLSSSDASELKKLMKNIITAEKHLMQLRFIDLNGDELIRFDRRTNLGDILEVPQNKLQNKRYRNYVSLNINKAAKIWFSELNLNMEYGKIEKPFKPTFRVVLPVWYKNDFRGMVVINYFAEVMLTNVFTQNFDYLVSITDEDGYIIHSSDPKQNWSKFQEPPFKSKGSYIYREVLQLPFTNKLFMQLDTNEDYVQNMYIQQEKHIQKVSLYIVLLLFAVTLVLYSLVRQSKLRIESVENKLKLQEKLISESKQKDMLNNIIDKNVITSTTDLRGIIKDVSTAFCEISGFSKEELIGHQHNIVRHSDMPEALYKDLWTTLKQDKVWKGKIKNKKKDGSIYWVDASLEPLYDENGKKIGYSAIRHDITDEMLKIEKEKELFKAHQELTKLNEDLEEALDRYHQALVVAQDGIWDWDVESMNVYYSPMWKLMLGYEDDEIKNEFSEWERLVHPDDLEASRAEALRLANGEITQYAIEFRMLCKDGSYKWILSKAKTIKKDSNNKPVRIVGIHVDLQNHKDLLKGVLDSSPSGIMAFSAIKDQHENIIDFKWTLVNKQAEKIVGRSASDLLGKHLLVEMPGNKEDGLFDIYVDVTNSRKDVEREFFYEHEGLKHWFHQIIVPYKDGFVVTFTDVTQNKRLQEEHIRKEQLLIQQSKMAAMGEMIANIAHQWKQPLSMLSLSILSLQKKYSQEFLDDAYMSKFVANSQKFIEKMDATISDFTNFYSPNKQKENFDVVNSVKYVCDFFDPLLQKNKIDIQINNKVKSDECYIFGVKSEFEQVVVNLVRNSIDIILQNKVNDGFIELNIFENDNDVEVSCIDNGGGVPKEIIDRVFEPYFTTKFKAEGVGIGLYMCKVILEESFNGKIFVDVNQGKTMFRAVLPKVSEKS